MRFAAVAKPVRAASLLISVRQWFGGVAPIEVYKMSPPHLLDDAGGVTLEGDSRVFFQSESFEEKRFSRLFAMPTNQFNQYEIVRTDRGRALKVWFDARTNLVLDTSIPVWPEADEAAFEYDVMVCPGFAPSDGGKMPGFTTATKPDDVQVLKSLPDLAGIPPGTLGTPLAGNGGARVSGRDGWTLRGGHGVPFPAGHPLEGHVGIDNYAYHADMGGLFGDSWLWSQRGPQGLQIGKWHRIYQRLKVNTPGRRDGVLECRIDGALVFRKTDVYLRDVGPYDLRAAPYNVDTSLGIRRVWLNMYHGGVARPPARFPGFLLRRLKVARIS
jgi:hypothetical protein